MRAGLVTGAGRGGSDGPALAAPPRPRPRGPLPLPPEGQVPCQGWPCWASRPCWAGRSCGGRAPGPKGCRVQRAGPGHSVCVATLQHCLAWGLWGSKRRSPGPGVGVSGRGRVGEPGGWPTPWRHVSLRPDCPRCPPSGSPTGILQAVSASRRPLSQACPSRPTLALCRLQASVCGATRLSWLTAPTGPPTGATATQEPTPLDSTPASPRSPEVQGVPHLQRACSLQDSWGRKGWGVLHQGP